MLRSGLPQAVAIELADLARNRPRSLHPGYLLPTVAGGSMAGNAAALAGRRTTAWLAFGIGVLSWVQIGPTIFGRLFFAEQLPVALRPPLADGPSWFWHVVDPTVSDSRSRDDRRAARVRPPRAARAPFGAGGRCPPRPRPCP